MNKTDLESIEKIIISTLTRLSQEGLAIDISNLQTETALYGRTGILSSLSVISLIVELESEILVQYGRKINITGDKMFSQSQSPLSTIGSLANYLNQLMNES